MKYLQKKVANENDSTEKLIGKGTGRGRGTGKGRGLHFRKRSI